MTENPEPPRPTRLTTRRLFFALWPSDALRQQLARDHSAVVRESGGRVTPPANYHVTVVFIGEQLEARLDAIIAAGAATMASSFTLQFDHLELWRGSRVLVLPVTRTPEALALLANRLRVNLLKQQVKLKPEVYRPHITLARKLPRLMVQRPVAPFDWSVEEFVLVDSTASEHGSRYQILARWPLQLSS